MSGFSHCNDRLGLITVCCHFNSHVCDTLALTATKQFNLVFGDQILLTIMA